MTHNSLDPGFVIIHYTRGAVPHQQVIPVLWSTAPTVGADPSLLTKAGGTVLGSVGVNAYILLFKVLFFTDVTFQDAEFWYKATETSDPVWIFTHPLGVAGTGVGSSTIAHQIAMTYRTGTGGIFRLYAMEPAAVWAGNQKQSWPTWNVGGANVANYLMGTTSWVVGRDNGYLVVPIRLQTKTNDALRRKLILFT